MLKKLKEEIKAKDKKLKRYRIEIYQHKKKE